MPVPRKSTVCHVANFLPTILTFPTLRRRDKNFCRFRATADRNGTGYTRRVANPQRSTWRLDFVAELSRALKALSPLSHSPSRQPAGGHTPTHTHARDAPGNSRFIFPTRRTRKKEKSFKCRPRIDSFLHFNESKNKNSPRWTLLLRRPRPDTRRLVISAIRRRHTREIRSCVQVDVFTIARSKIRTDAELLSRRDVARGKYPGSRDSFRFPRLVVFERDRKRDCIRD